MNRLLTLLCLFATMAAGGLGVRYFQAESARKALATTQAGAQQRIAYLENEAAAAAERVDVLKARATGLETELGAQQGKLTAAETRAQAAEERYAQAKTVLALYDSTSRALADEVGALRKDLSDARVANASPEAVAGYKATIADLERQLANAREGAAATGTAGASTAVFASRPGRATVLTVGPESAFVVLNFGTLRGAQVGQKLEVSQGQGTPVAATVLISDVRANFSIAHVLPDSLRGVLHKGDLALLLR